MPAGNKAVVAPEESSDEAQPGVNVMFMSWHPPPVDVTLQVGYPGLFEMDNTEKTVAELNIPTEYVAAQGVAPARLELVSDAMEPANVWMYW